MSKYIIEIEDTPFTTPFTDHALYKAKKFISLVFDEEGLAKMEKMTDGYPLFHDYTATKRIATFGELIDSKAQAFAVFRSSPLVVRLMTRDALFGEDLSEFFRHIENLDIYEMERRE